MKMSGGGLITNSRTDEPSNTLPESRPVKQMQPATQAAPAPQQPQGGLISPQAPPQAPQPQSAPQGQPQPQQGQINDVANNALSLLHDPQAAPEFEKLIAMGPKGAAEATAAIYEQVSQAHEQNGSPISDENAGPAAEAIIQDISEIGVAMGSFAQEPMIDGMPASIMEYVARTSELLVGKYPALAEALQTMAGEQLDPADDQAAQQLAQYIGQGEGNVQG